MHVCGRASKMGLGSKMSKPWPMVEEYPEYPKLVRAPLARVCAEARKRYTFSGITPFALSRVSRHSPQEVLKELERECREERVLIEMYLCTTIYLPVVSVCPTTQPDGPGELDWSLDDQYNEELAFTLDDVQCDADMGRISPKEAEKLASQLLTMEQLLKRFGASGWEWRLRLNFDPWGRVKRFFPSGALKALREVYLSGLPAKDYL